MEIRGESGVLGSELTQQWKIKHFTSVFGSVKFQLEDPTCWRYSRTCRRKKTNQWFLQDRASSRGAFPNSACLEVEPGGQVRAGRISPEAAAANRARGVWDCSWKTQIHSKLHNTGIFVSWEGDFACSAQALGFAARRGCGASQEVPIWGKFYWYLNFSAGAVLVWSKQPILLPIIVILWNWNCLQ